MRLLRRARGRPGAARALAIACIANFVPNFAQYRTSPYAVELMDALGVGRSEFFLLFTAPMIPAIFLSVVGGLLIDRIGPKRVIATALIVTTLGCGMHVMATSYPVMLLGTAMTGLAAGFLMSGAGKILAL